MTELLKGKRDWSDTKDDDFGYYAKQTGVDMCFGVDIALLAQKEIGRSGRIGGRG